MLSYELEKVIKGRRSIRKWKDEQIPMSYLRKAVELATWAPNGGNYQSWYFVIVDNNEVIDEMADAVQSVADRLASWPESEQYKEQITRSQKNAALFRNAPACVAVFAGRYQSALDKLLMSRRDSCDEAKRILDCRHFAPTAIQGTAAAVQNMLLAFHDMNLGAVWLGAPLIAKREIESILGIKENMDLSVLSL